jgi:hypothetical protein
MRLLILDELHQSRAETRALLLIDQDDEFLFELATAEYVEFANNQVYLEKLSMRRVT